MDSTPPHGSRESSEPRTFSRSTLDLSLAFLRLPARMDNYAYSHGLETLYDLIKLDPATLLKVRNLGRVSLQQTRAAVERVLGRPWEVAREELSRLEAAALTN